jgi:hypothetical protein
MSRATLAQERLDAARTRVERLRGEEDEATASQRGPLAVALRELADAEAVLSRCRRGAGAKRGVA